MNLNAEQKLAISVREGAYNIVATAGSGKTTVLVERVRQLFAEGVSPADLLAVTFTREAAENMNARLYTKGNSPSKDLRGGFRTFHSFCLNLVRKEARFLPYGLSASPLPEGLVLYRMLLDSMRQNIVPRNELDAVRAYISLKKRLRILPHTAVDDPLENHLYARAYMTYEAKLRDGGMLDFDSMIVEAVNMLEKHDEVRERWQFKWVLADETQDTDDLQFRLLQLVSQSHGNIFIVGDFCQCIYNFRGAHPENLLNFEKWFPNAKTIILPENFRSTPEVVQFAKENAPIDNELTRNIRTANPSRNLPVEFRMYSGPVEEAEAVLAVANQDPGNSAILARTNQQLGIYETLCLQHEIKFYLLGQSGLWNKPEINMLVSLATFCTGDKTPMKGSEKLVEPYRRHIRTKTPEAGLKEIIRHANMEELYSNSDYSDDENFALSNLRAVVDISKRFRTLGEFLNHARKAAHASRKSKNAVTLSTVHQAKGLEWHNVFVVGCQYGKMPHEKGEIGEEKRIFYVAISRPSRRLRISFAGTPSPFLDRYLTPEIQTELRKYATVVEKIQKQQELFA